MEGNTGHHEHHIHCLRCGRLVHWTSSVCENCLTDPIKDRRGAPRVNFRRTFMHNGFLATVQNISGGGVQIKTGTALSVGEELKIAFSLEAGMLSFGGIIVYAQSLSDGNWLAGVAFTDLSDKDSELLKRFLDSHLLKKHRNGSIYAVRR